MLETAKRRRGRPRDPGKRSALLQAARSLFLKQGTSVTLDQVLARARVSRATLYSCFKNKGELLAAVIGNESDRIVTEQWARDRSDQSLEMTLIEFGQKLLPFIAEADTLAFERLIAQAALAEPEYGTRFFSAGPGRTRSILMEVISTGQARGEIGACDPERAVSDLIGLWQGFWRLEVQYGQRVTVTAVEIDEFVLHGVRQFLKLYSSGAR